MNKQKEGFMSETNVMKDAKTVLKYLNDSYNRTYEMEERNLKDICLRLAEGYSVEDMITVIDNAAFENGEKKQ